MAIRPSVENAEPRLNKGMRRIPNGVRLFSIYNEALLVPFFVLI
jgi:hypothetical protein